MGQLMGSVSQIQKNAAHPAIPLMAHYAVSPSSDWTFQRSVRGWELEVRL